MTLPKGKTTFKRKYYNNIMVPVPFRIPEFMENV